MAVEPGFLGIMRREGETSGAYLTRMYEETRTFGEQVDEAIIAAEASDMDYSFILTLRELRAGYFIRTGMLMAKISQEDRPAPFSPADEDEDFPG